jgi:Skp family chaperone for outer membrane proteins
MGRFPSGAKYVAALQNTTACFEDTQLRGANPQRTRLGLPRPISGQFASVFSLTSSTGPRYAVKCFTREVSDQAHRYQAISRHLAPVSQPWKVGFEYLQKGIWVDGDWYPVLKMEWMDAISLTGWIDKHLGDRTALAGLADRFAIMIAELSDSGIGHGDLQHGNLLVARDGSLRLVDYDGMYVPALAGLAATESGHRNYQSPLRSSADFGPALDRFSAWVIYLSLFAVATDPVLWQQLRPDGAEHLLLAHEDFTQPTASYRLGTLLNHTEPRIRHVAGLVQDILTAPLNVLPALQPLLVAPINQPGARTPVTPGVAASGLPGWMTGHVGNAVMTAPVAFHQRPPTLSAFGRAGLVVLLIGILLAGLGITAGAALVAAALAAVLVFAGWSAIRYRRVPETVQARALRADRNRLKKQLRRADQDLGAAEQHKNQLTKDAEAAHARDAVEQRKLTTQHDREVATVQREAQQQLNMINQKLADMATKHSQALSAALRGIQEQYVAVYLARFAVAAEKIDGIGKKLIDNLHTSGIFTAADFIDVHYYRTAQYQTISADFKLRSGRLVHVDGIGEVKANAIANWQKKHKDRALTTRPATLPVSTKNSIDGQFVALTNQLRTERRHIESHQISRMSSLRQRHNADLTALRDELRRQSAQAARALDDQNKMIIQKRQDLNLTRTKVQDNTASFLVYRQISYVRYALFLLSLHRATTS